MERMRCVRPIAEHFRELDPETCVTEYWLRNAVRDGVIPSIKVGYKTMTSIEAVERVLADKLGGAK